MRLVRNECTQLSACGEMPYKARIKWYRIAICDAKFAVCDVTLILCRKFCDATFACKSAIIGYPCA